MSIADRLAIIPARLEVFCSLFGGPLFDGVEATPGTISTSPTFAALTEARMVFVPAAMNKFQTTFPEVAVWVCDWLVFALLGVDIQVGHIRYDDTHAYRITAEPVTHYGFVLAPAAAIPLSQVPASFGPILLDDSGAPLLDD